MAKKGSSDIDAFGGCFFSIYFSGSAYQMLVESN